MSLPPGVSPVSSQEFPDELDESGCAPRKKVRRKSLPSIPEIKEEECLIRIVNLASLQEPLPSSPASPSPPPQPQASREQNAPVQNPQHPPRLIKSGPYFWMRGSAQNQNPPPSIAPPAPTSNPQVDRPNYGRGIIPFGGQAETTTLSCGLVILDDKLDGFQYGITNDCSTPRKYQIKKMIYVSNMSRKCDSKCVYCIFNVYGKILNVRMEKNGPNDKAHALVTFQRPCEASIAIKYGVGLEHFDHHLNITPYVPQRNNNGGSSIPQMPGTRAPSDQNTTNPAIPQRFWMDPRLPKNMNGSERSQHQHKQMQPHPRNSIWSTPNYNHFTMQNRRNGILNWRRKGGSRLIQQHSRPSNIQFQIRRNRNFLEKQKQRQIKEKEEQNIVDRVKREPASPSPIPSQEEVWSPKPFMQKQTATTTVVYRGGAAPSQGVWFPPLRDRGWGRGFHDQRNWEEHVSNDNRGEDWRPRLRVAPPRQEGVSRIFCNALDASISSHHANYQRMQTSTVNFQTDTPSSHHFVYFGA